MSINYKDFYDELEKEFQNISKLGTLDLYHSYIVYNALNVLIDNCENDIKIAAISDLFKICNIISLSEDCKLTIQYKSKLYTIFKKINDKILSS